MISNQHEIGLLDELFIYLPMNLRLSDSDVIQRSYDPFTDYFLLHCGIESK